MKGNPITRRLLLAIFALILFHPLNVLGSGIITPQSSPDAPYSISGTILDIYSWQGISGATVKVRDESNNLVAAVKTDSTGHYVINIVNPGYYVIWVAKTGLEQFSAPERPIELSNWEKTASITLFMSPAGTETFFPLSEGWNFISMREEPPDTAIESVFQDISANIWVVWSWDNIAQRWLKYIPSESNNSLFTIESCRGYWVLMKEASSLNTTGWALPQGFAIRNMIPLYQGWNLVGLGSQNDTDLTRALEKLSDKWTIIWSWQAGTWKAKHSTLQTLPVPQLTGFSLDKAYWILMKPVPKTNWAP